MEQDYSAEGVRERLLLSGLSELEEHGVKDFSLRRVASAAQVSCAAPYRHFKDKDELILAVIRYVREGWFLLCREIGSAYTDDKQAEICELCTLGIRFWLANGSFRSVLFGGMGDTDENRQREIALFDKPIVEATESYAKERGFTKEQTVALCYSVSTAFWGTLTLCAGGRDTDGMLTLMKKKLLSDLSK